MTCQQKPLNQLATAQPAATTTATKTSANNPKRYTKEQLLARNMPEIIIAPLEKMFNRLKWHKITRRTWAEKSEKKKEEIKSQQELTRSICNKNDDLKQIIDDNNADIIIITETWLNTINEDEQLKAIKKNSPEYDIISQKRIRDDVNGGGGVMIMIKQKRQTYRNRNS